MNRRDETAPLQTSFILSTQFSSPPPPPPTGQKRGSMPSPRWSSLPPRPPKRPTTTTFQQTEFQNFNNGPRLPPQSPVFGSSTPMSPAPSSFGGFQSAPPPVAYHNAELPPLPTTSVVSAHSRAFYGDNNAAGLPSMDAMQMMYPESIEFPLGVNYSMEGHGAKESGIGEPASFMDEYLAAYMELDDLFDFSVKNDDVERISTGGSSKNKRKAATNPEEEKRAEPSRRVRRKSVDCNNLNNGNSSITIGNCVFTASEMDEISRCDTLKNQLFTDPRNVKRILYNRDTARRTHQRNAQHVLELEERVQALEKEVDTVAAHTSIAERTKFGLEEENKQMKIRIREMEEQAKGAIALTESYCGEINHLKQKGTGEVFLNSVTPIDDDIWELLNQLDEEEPKTNYYGFGLKEPKTN